MNSKTDRFEDLLIQRGLDGLNDAEALELNALAIEFPQSDAESLDRTMAAIEIANLKRLYTLPDHLKSQIEKQAATIVTANVFSSPAVETAMQTQKAANDSTFLPWLVAGIAAALALIAWLPEAINMSKIDVASQRTALIDTGAVVQTWTVTDDPAALSASGDVVWDSSKQQGYMRMLMLRANDPSEFQYQLWIFDAERDERFPVDGGVFDIPPGSREVIVPIQATLPVGNPVLFAITVERPGGVVVSNRERIVLLAELG